MGTAGRLTRLRSGRQEEAEQVEVHVEEESSGGGGEGVSHGSWLARSSGPPISQAPPPQAQGGKGSKAAAAASCSFSPAPKPKAAALLLLQLLLLLLLLAGRIDLVVLVLDERVGGHDYMNDMVGGKNSTPTFSL